MHHVTKEQLQNKRHYHTRPQTETKIYASVPYITGITDRFEERVRQEQ